MTIPKDKLPTPLKTTAVTTLTLYRKAEQQVDVFS